MKATTLALGAVCLAISTGATAEEVSVSVGVRAWNNIWHDNALARDSNGVPVIPRQVVRVDHGPKTTAIPFALVRYGNFGVAASAFTSTTYVEGPKPRREYDINALYFFLPSASVSVGYKEIRYNNVKAGGVTAALSGSAPLHDNFGVYANVGLGRMETDVDVPLPQFQGLKTSYVSLEAGFSYAIPAFVGKSAALTLGYRYQQFKFREWPLGGQVTDRATLTDSTNGPVAGFVVTF